MRTNNLKEFFIVLTYLHNDKQSLHNREGYLHRRLAVYATHIINNLENIHEYTADAKQNQST